MFIPNQEIKMLRDCDLELHCKELKLYQDQVVNGFILIGHGIIKSNKFGNLFLEFVCTETQNNYLGARIPNSLYQDNEYLKLEAKTINGFTVRSSGIKLESMNLFQPGQSFLSYIPIRSFFLEDQPIRESEFNRFLHFEFKEKCQLPTNKNNTTESTLDGRSFSWNETIIEDDDFKVNIVRRDEYTTVTAYTNQYDLKLIEYVITFYIGFSNGSLPQIYFINKRENELITYEFKSINNIRSHLSIASPMSSHVRTRNNKSYDENHFSLLKNMLHKSFIQKSLFKCTYSHWKRIWHSFQSADENVSAIILTSSIEGILNDVYIPFFEKTMCSKFLNDEKENLIKKINKIDGIPTNHLNTLLNSIKKWGNIHPQKALSVLVEKGAINEKEKKNWIKLRNSSSHPRLTKLSNDKKQKQDDRLYSCLCLFYKLVFNIYNYDGAYFDFNNLTSSTMLQMNHVEVLKTNQLQ